VRKADNLPPSCAVVMKSGNLNFLEPSGPLQACNGTALPLPLYREKSLKPLQAVASTVCLIYKGVFADICSLFSDPNFTIVIIPTQVAWSF